MSPCQGVMLSFGVGMLAWGALILLVLTADRPTKKRPPPSTKLNGGSSGEGPTEVDLHRAR